jgi:hypothetical protein
MIVKAPIIKAAAASLIIIAALIARQHFEGSLDSVIPAFADALRNEQGHRTVICLVSFPATGTTVQVTALEPCYVKAEQPNGHAWLLDRRGGKLILINPAKKTAEIVRSIQNQPQDVYETLQDLTNACRHSAKRIGRRRMGQKQAIGFHLAEENGDEAFVWLNPQTRLPVRIEVLATNQKGQVEPEIIYSDIVFDIELDESLFRIDLAGYEVEEVDSGCVDGRLGIRYWAAPEQSKWK